MYRVFLDGLPVHAPGSESQILLDPIIDEGIDKIGNFTFRMAVNNPFYGDVKKLKSVVKIYSGNEELWEGRVLDESLDWNNTKAITCEGVMGYFLDSIQRPFFEHLADREYLEFLLAEHNRQVEEHKQFHLGQVDVAITTEDDTWRENSDYKETKDLLDNLTSQYGGHFIARKVEGKRYLDYLTEYPGVSTQAIEFGKNLLDLKRELKGTNIATAVIVLGATSGGERLTIADCNDGLDYLENVEAIEKFGRVCRVFTFDKIEEEEELLEEAKKKLEEVSNPKTAIDVTALDLNLVDEEIEAIAVGSRAKSISIPHGVDEYLQVNNRRLHLTEPTKTEYTLGGEQITSSGRSISVLHRLKALEEDMEKIKEKDV